MNQNEKRNRAFIGAATRELGPRAKQVLDYVMEHPKATQKEIGKALGISNQRVSQIINHHRYETALPELAKKKLKQMIPEAVQTQGDLMRQRENLEVARKVSERVLDTAKVLETQSNITVNVFQTMQTDDLRRVVEQAKPAASDVIDAELSE